MTGSALTKEEKAGLAPHKTCLSLSELLWPARAQMRTSRRMKKGASRRERAKSQREVRRVSIMQKVSSTTTTRHLELHLYNGTRDRKGKKENKRGSSVSRQVERERD